MTYTALSTRVEASFPHAASVQVRRREQPVEEHGAPGLAVEVVGPLEGLGPAFLQGRRAQGRRADSNPLAAVVQVRRREAADVRA